MHVQHTQQQLLGNNLVEARKASPGGKLQPGLVRGVALCMLDALQVWSVMFACVLIRLFMRVREQKFIYTRAANHKAAMSFTCKHTSVLYYAGNPQCRLHPPRREAGKRVAGAAARRWVFLQSLCSKGGVAGVSTDE